MSKNVAVFVDVANLYYSARGQDVDVDYVALLKAATKGRDLIRAYAYSGLDPENENQRKFIDFLGKNGYKVLTKDIRKFGDGRVKANLDIELVVDLFRLADRMDIAVIVSGDGDFAPAIRALQDKGVRCEVISFRPNTSSDLLAVTDEFTDIMKIIGIGRGSKEAKADSKRMSAPEMPAKEVVPEFGFREASPGVAKAALAALREGRSPNGERGRRRSRSAAPSESPAEAPAAAVEAEPQGETNGAATAEGEQRRRRRRRGGRGRGRGRGRADQPATEGAAAIEGDGEIGWVEVDDLSQLDELEGIDLGEDREYTFEEADAATLAELGIGPEAVAARPPTTEEAEPKKPTRRRTRAKVEGAEPQTADGRQATAEEAEPKKPARRRTSTSRTPTSRTSTTRTSSSRTTRSRAGSDDAPSADATEPEQAATPEKPTARGRSTARSRSTAGTSTAKSAKRKAPSEADAEPKKPAPRRSRSARQDPGGAESTAKAEPAEGEPEGIWQRFRSARTTR